MRMGGLKRTAKTMRQVQGLCDVLMLVLVRTEGRVTWNDAVDSSWVLCCCKAFIGRDGVRLVAVSCQHHQAQKGSKSDQSPKRGRTRRAKAFLPHPLFRTRKDFSFRFLSVSCSDMLLRSSSRVSGRPCSAQ